MTFCNERACGTHEEEEREDIDTQKYGRCKRKKFQLAVSCYDNNYIS